MKKELLKFVVLALLAIGGGPAGAAIWNWSTTASTNATADPSINWSEGMAPSAVNDSARAMMAGIAAWRNDISGVNTTTGTSTAYALATSEGVNTTPATGQMIAFIAHATNGTSPTLAVDGGTAYPIWLNGASAGAGTLILGSPYRVAFSATNSAWVLEGGLGNPYQTPLGGLLWSTVETVPNSNFVIPSGQCISTTTYAAYWVAKGSPASGGCPGGQFAILDMRGRAPAALDTLNASAAGRLTSSSTGCGTAFTTVGAVCANESQSTTITTLNLPPYSPAGGITNGAITMSANVTLTPGATNAALALGASTGGQTLTPSVVTMTQATTSFNGTAQGGTSTPIPRVQPVIGLVPFLRVL